MANKQELRKALEQIGRDIDALTAGCPVAPNGQLIISSNKSEKLVKLLLRERGIRKMLDQK